MKEMREVVQIKYSDLADLIFILSNQFVVEQGIEEEGELSLEDFAGWLYEQKGTVALRESIPKEEAK